MMLNNNSIGINKVKESDISLEGNSNNLVNLDDSMKIYLKDGYVKAQALEVTHGKGTDA